MNDFQIRCKIWIEIDGKPLLGNGRMRLLQAITEHGSLNAAAKDLGISYRKVWAQIQEMERIAPFPMFISRTGGSAGGATKLTAQAQSLLNQFQQVGEEIQGAVDTICEARVDKGVFTPGSNQE